MKASFAAALVLCACHSGDKGGPGGVHDPLVGGWVSGTGTGVCFGVKATGPFCPQSVCDWSRESERLISVELPDERVETVQADTTDAGLDLAWRADGAVIELECVPSDAGVCP